MSSGESELERHVRELRACERCPRMHRPAISGGAVESKVMLVGQAPGDKEPKLQRPFAWTAGKTLFRWFEEHCGIDETAFRERIYIAAVCRCYPGKNPKGGDRVPSREEIANCTPWLEREFELLEPSLLLPVGKLAISRFMECRKLVDVIGQCVEIEVAGRTVDCIPLPHPSGASTWHRAEPGKSLTVEALELVRDHPAFRAAIAGRSRD